MGAQSSAYKESKQRKRGTSLGSVAVWDIRNADWGQPPSASPSLARYCWRSYCDEPENAAIQISLGRK